MNKAYKRINWENRPSTATPFNETNMNKMDYALDTVDTRVVELYNQKDAMASATINANKAADSANAAATSANTAAFNANEAAQAVLDEKYILTARTEMVRSGTARPTAKGNAILEKLTGDGWQRKLTGKNKLDKSLLINSSEWKYFDIQAEANTTYTASCTIPSANRTDISFFAFNSSGSASGNTNQVDADTTRTFTTGDDGIIRVQYKVSDTTSYDITKYDFQIEYGAVATEIEPYCGGVPSPNPSFKQEIRSIGDMGWFDGEWLQGCYSTSTGKFVEHARFVCSKNSIPCQEGDVVRIVLEKAPTYAYIFYHNESGFVSFSRNNLLDNSFTVPSGVTKCHIEIEHSDNLTPQTVGHVCVTINGKYAAIVDEIGKNLIDVYEFYKNANKYGVAVVDGRTCIKFNSGKKMIDEALSFKPNTQYTFKGYYKSVDDDGDCPLSTGDIIFTFFYTDGSNDHAKIGVNSDWNKYTLTSRVGKTVDYIGIASMEYRQIVYVDVDTFQLEEGSVASNVTPHQSTRTYIPLDEPLRGIGDVKDEICYRDGLYGVYREYSEKVYKGSDFINISNAYSSVKYYALPKPTDSKYYNNNGQYETICDKFEYNLQYGIDNEYCIHLLSSNASTTHLWFGFPIGTSLEEVQAIGEIKVVYPLAEPIFTPFEDQTPFYNLMAYDEVTHVSIAGLHEELEPTLTMRFPRHEDGALVTTAYCNSKKEAIERKAEMEEIKAAVLALSQL